MHVVFYESNPFVPIVNSDDDVEIIQKDMQIQVYDTSKEESVSAQSPIKEKENSTE